MKSKILAIRELIRNFLSLAGAEVLAKLITFAVFAYIARLAGPAGYGYIEWAAAILMCASLIVDQGFSGYGSREIARDPAQTERVVREIVTARVLLAGLGYAAIAAFAFFFVRDSRVFDLLLVYGLSLWALPFVMQWVFQGHDKMNLVAVTQVIRQITFAAVVLSFLRTPDDLLAVGFAEVAAAAAAAAFSVWIYRTKILRTRFELRPAVSARLFREGVPIGLSQMFWVVRMFGATLILGLVATSEDTGYFAGALRVLIALHTFVWLYFFNLFPSLSRAWATNPGEFTRLIRNSMLLVCLISAPVGLVWVVAAPTAITFIYGPAFSIAGSSLQWMAGICVAAALSGHFRFGLIAAGYQNREMFCSALGAVSAVVLVPLWYLRAGPGGAAAGLFVAELLVLLASWIFAKKILESVGSTEPRLNEFPEVVR